jgi:hypothetical protein
MFQDSFIRKKNTYEWVCVSAIHTQLGGTAPRRPGRPHFRGFTIKFRHTLVRTPLGEWSARSTDLYLTTHNTHQWQYINVPAGFEPAIPGKEMSPWWAWVQINEPPFCIWKCTALLHIRFYKNCAGLPTWRNVKSRCVWSSRSKTLTIPSISDCFVSQNSYKLRFIIKPPSGHYVKLYREKYYGEFIALKVRWSLKPYGCIQKYMELEVTIRTWQ